MGLRQLVVLLLLALAHVAYLRMFVPFRMRLDQATETAAAAGDVAIFFLALCLSGSSPPSDSRRRALLSPLLMSSIFALDAVLQTAPLDWTSSPRSTGRPDHAFVRLLHAASPSSCCLFSYGRGPEAELLRAGVGALICCNDLTTGNRNERAKLLPWGGGKSRLIAVSGSALAE